MAAYSHPNRVLVLDDDEVMNDLVEAFLSLDGAEVTKTYSGKDALTLLRSGQRVDLILTDLQMPGLEGNELVASLREAVDHDVLLVGMSASQPPDKTLALLDAFLPKPFDLPALHGAVGAAREARGAASQRDEDVDGLLFPAGVTDALGDIAVLDDEIFQSLAKMIPHPKLRELYDLTLADIGKRQRRIEEAVDERDSDTAKREAHAIKGSCGMVGAMELQALAAEIEGGTTLNTSALQQIPAACLRLRRMLDTKFQTA